MWERIGYRMKGVQGEFQQEQEFVYHRKNFGAIWLRLCEPLVQAIVGWMA